MSYKSLLKLSISMSVNRIINKAEISKDINYFALKVDKLKIVEVKGKTKLYKEKKEVSTLPLKEERIETTRNRFINLSEKGPFLQNAADGT